MSPLPGWRVIPEGFEEYHRPTVAQTFTAMCVVKRPGGPPPFPKPDGWQPDTVLWTGMCRLQQLQREGDPVTGDQPTQTRAYLLALPFTNGQGIDLPELNTGEGGDFAVVRDRVFNLKQPLHGSILWERDYMATENITQQQPG